jgi:ABC-type sugar transport system substrate-binding protein
MLPQIEGDAKILWPAEVPSGTYITGAVDGFEARADELGRTVEIEVLDASSDPTTSASRQLAYLVANPDTDAIVTTGSIAIAAATTAMRQGDLEPGSPALAGFVTNAQGYQGVKDGYMKEGIWPDLDEDSRQAIRDLVDMVTDDVVPPARVQQWVIVDAMNVDEVVPEALRS